MNLERIYDVIKAPHVSEKAAMGMGNERQQYVFKVAINANKFEIAKAVEAIFEVKVDAVNTVVVKGKSKRFGRFEGKRKDFKKAYVTLKQGESIDFADAE